MTYLAEPVLNHELMLAILTACNSLMSVESKMRVCMKNVLQRMWCDFTILAE